METRSRVVARASGRRNNDDDAPLLADRWRGRGRPARAVTPGRPIGRELRTPSSRAAGRARRIRAVSSLAPPPSVWIVPRRTAAHYTRHGLAVAVAAATATAATTTAATTTAVCAFLRHVSSTRHTHATDCLFVVNRRRRRARAPFRFVGKRFLGFWFFFIRRKCFENAFERAPETAYRLIHPRFAYSRFILGVLFFYVRINTSAVTVRPTPVQHRTRQNRIRKRHDPRKPFRDVRLARLVHQEHEGNCFVFYFFYFQR